MECTGGSMAKEDEHTPAMNSTVDGLEGKEGVARKSKKTD